MLFAVGLINFRIFMKIGWEYFEFQYVIYSIQWSQMEKVFLKRLCQLWKDEYCLWSLVGQSWNVCQKDILEIHFSNITKAW